MRANARRHVVGDQHGSGKVRPPASFKYNLKADRLTHVLLPSLILPNPWYTRLLLHFGRG